MPRRSRSPLLVVAVAAALVAVIFLWRGARGQPSAAMEAPGASHSGIVEKKTAPAGSAAATPITQQSPSAAPNADPNAEKNAKADATKEPADAHFVRFYRAPLAGGLLMFPPSFHSEDGVYDLVLHLNGNTDLVEQSYGFAGVNAVVAILNLGVGSGVYESRFEDPAGLRLILSRAQEVMVARGLKNARLGRIGLSSWSSGYGGIIKILLHEEFFDRINAIVLVDSIHCGYDKDTKKLKADQIEPIRRYAKKAVESKALLSIVHSEIVTYGYYNAHDTTDFVLNYVRVPRTATNVWQPLPDIPARKFVVPNEFMKPLDPLTEAHRGELHVRGYGGTGPYTHMLHLVQFSTTALPDLVRYWGRR